MPANPIDGIGSSAPQDPLRPRKTTEGAEPSSKADLAPTESHDSARETTTPAGGGEKLQISREARDLLELSDLMSAAKKSLDEQPEVRAERIRQVRERLKAGAYDTQGIRDELAHRLSSILRDLPLDDA